MTMLLVLLALAIVVYLVLGVIGRSATPPRRDSVAEFDRALAALDPGRSGRSGRPARHSRQIPPARRATRPAGSTRRTAA